MYAASVAAVSYCPAKRHLKINKERKCIDLLLAIQNFILMTTGTFYLAKNMRLSNAVQENIRQYTWFGPGR
jgi:hypothetical protein